MKEPHSLSSDTFPWIIITPQLFIHRSRGWWEIITQNKVDPHGELSPQDQNGLPPSPVETTKKNSVSQLFHWAQARPIITVPFTDPRTVSTLCPCCWDLRTERTKTTEQFEVTHSINLFSCSLNHWSASHTSATLDTWSLLRLTQVQTGRLNRERKLEWEMKKEVQALGMIKVMKLQEFK